MKLASLIVLIFTISICFGQREMEAEYGLEEGSISDENYQLINSVDNKVDDATKFEFIIQLLESDSTENIVKVYLLEEYLSGKHFHEANFVHWLVNNIGYEIDKNAYTLADGWKKDKYPILYFLAQLGDSDIFNAEDLLKSDFLSNCKLFEDAYTKKYTCKLMAEYFIKSGIHKSELFEIASQEECMKKNFEQIMKFCF